MKKHKTKKATHLSKILVTIMLLALLFSFTGCGADDDVSSSTNIEEEQDKDEKKDESEKAKDEAEDSKSDDEKKDTSDEAKAEVTEPVVTEPVVTEPAVTEPDVQEPDIPETIPTLEELIAFNSDTQNLSQNYKVDLKLAFGMEFESEGVTEGISMNMVGENLSYENVSCSDISVDMNFMGMEQVTNEKQYTITDIDGMTTEYTYSAEEDVWYKSEYVDFEEDTVDGLMGDFLDTEAGGFSVVETTNDDENIYITAIVSPDLDLEGVDLFSGLGMENIDFSATCNFVFDKATHVLVSLEIVCEYGDLVSEDLRENGVKSISIDEFTVLFMPNNTPVSVPEDVIANAVVEDEDDYDWEFDTEDDYDWEFDTEDDYDWEFDTEVEESIHEGWGFWYNDYCEETGMFPMYYNGEEIQVTLNGQDNWYFDNSMETIAQLAVRDDSLVDDCPAYEVNYCNSWCTVEEDIQGAKDYLIEYDYEEKYTYDDIVPLVVNERQCFCFVADETDSYRYMVILQDIGFDEYVEICISTYDVETDVLELAGKYMLNFVYDGE